MVNTRQAASDPQSAAAGGGGGRSPPVLAAPPTRLKTRVAAEIEKRRVVAADRADAGGSRHAGRADGRDPWELDHIIAASSSLAHGDAVARHQAALIMAFGSVSTAPRVVSSQASFAKRRSRTLTPSSESFE